MNRINGEKDEGQDNNNVEKRQRRVNINNEHKKRA
jgi:hypothetical protein